MKLFNTKRAAMDERIVHTRNMLYKEAYIVAILLCSISVVTKCIIYGLNIGATITELSILFLTALYYGIRAVFLGLYSDEVEVHDRTSKLSMNKKNMIWGLGFGVVMATFFGIKSALMYGEGNAQSLWYFILVFFASLMIYIPFFVGILAILHALAYKASKKVIDKDLDE
ncbi:DUF6773 family protein [Aneurinibacillus aneurinilyticus]|uniref:DUF6773 family protein n=1 Tax=Aneurinibacillus aneurinilyticus TaxID=1391 RepID=UPI0023F1B13D|nr:DUF6773 family protein [Aneurinibacillus aneurinilyticus]